MDFTYPFAFLLGLVFSVVPSLIMVSVRKHIPKNYRPALIITVAFIVLIISINWRELGSMPIIAIIVDFAFILIAAALGGLLGTLILRIRPRG
jgi:uncharacterized membrane protein YqgA involved in biofilm formation